MCVCVCVCVCMNSSPGQCDSVGWGVTAYTEGLQVRFLVQVHAWVAGLILSWGVCGRQLIDISHISFSLSLSVSLSLCFSPLSHSLKAMKKCP